MQFVHRPLVHHYLVVLDKPTHHSVFICSSEFCNHDHHLYNYLPYLLYYSPYTSEYTLKKSSFGFVIRTAFQ